MEEYVPNFIGHGKICGLYFKACKFTDDPLQYAFFVEGVAVINGSEALMRSLLYKITYLHAFCGSVEELAKQLISPTTN